MNPYEVRQDDGVAPFWVVWDTRHSPERRVAQFIFQWEAIGCAYGLAGALAARGIR